VAASAAVESGKRTAQPSSRVQFLKESSLSQVTDAISNGQDVGCKSMESNQAALLALDSSLAQEYRRSAIMSCELTPERSDGSQGGKGKGQEQEGVSGKREQRLVELYCELFAQPKLIQPSPLKIGACGPANST
jgi:hypothetical protein